MEKAKSKDTITKILDWVAKVGNAMPHPFWLFLIVLAFVMVCSNIVSLMGISVIHPGTQEEISAVPLISANGLRLFVENFLTNFQGFAVLSYLIVTMVGVGLAEKTGYIKAVMRRSILAAPTAIILPVLIFISINGNFAGDAAIVVIPPLAASIFLALGKNPLTGLVLSYGAMTAGWSANILISPSLDLVLLGFSESAAKIVDPDFTISPVANWYFIVVSAFVMTLVATFVTKKIVEPRLDSIAILENVDAENTADISEELEKKGLKRAVLAAVTYVAIVMLLVIPSGGVLRNVETGGLIPSPFFKGLILLLMLFFWIPSVVYGYTVGTIKKNTDIIKYMQDSISSVSSYILLIIVISQFVAAFNWSKLPIIMAVKGADFIRSIGFEGFPMVFCILVFAAIINIFIGSASSKWGLLAPVLVPMLMALGYHPAMATMIYRVGDSATNAITPLFPYFPILLGFAKKYTGKEEVGTLLAALLPYSVTFFLTWVVLIAIWMFLGLPLGPGGPIYM